MDAEITAQEFADALQFVGEKSLREIVAETIAGAPESWRRTGGAASPVKALGRALRLFTQTDVVAHEETVAEVRAAMLAICQEERPVRREVEECNDEILRNVVGASAAIRNELAAAQKLAVAWETLYRARDAYHRNSDRQEWLDFEAAKSAAIAAGAILDRGDDGAGAAVRR